MATKKQSRSQRWSDAANRAVNALEELVDMQSEFTDWKDGLPDNLQSGAMFDKLDTITSIDLESARDAAQEALDAEVPMGFGRD